MGKAQVRPHVVKPITAKERFRLSLAIVNPEPRAPKRIKLLDSVFRRVSELLLDSYVLDRANNLFSLGRCKGLLGDFQKNVRFGDVLVLEPQRLEAYLEKGLEVIRVFFFDVGESS